MCYRMAAKGWEIWRLDAAMTLHDAAMTSFGQWWRRSIRSGHAAAEALSRRGLGDVAAAKRVVSNVFWSMPFAWPIWPILAWRVYRKQGDLAYAASIVVGKLPHMQGQIKFWLGRLNGKRIRLIEYK